MHQVAHPGPLSIDRIEDAAIALLEAGSTDVIVRILLEISLARSEGDRAAVLLGADDSMAPVMARPADFDPAGLVSRVRRALVEKTVSTLVGEASVFREAAFPATALVVPLVQRAETVGALYIELDNGHCSPDPQTIGALAMFCRQAAASLVRLRLSASLERETDLRRNAEESHRQIYDSMLKHQRIGKMGDFRFNTRTLGSRGSAQCYTIFGYAEGTDLVEYGLWMATLHPDDRQRVHEEMHAAFAKRVPLRFEYRIVVGGETRHILSEGHPEIDANGDLLYCGVVVDVTEQKAVEAAFANMQSELSTALRLASLGELAGSVVHEVNQPLTAIMANADACRRWLSMSPINVEEAREAADHVSLEARRAASVVSGLEALAKGARTQFTEFPIRDIIAEVLLLLKPHLERTKISTQVALSDDMPPIVGDRLQLQQVVFNMVRNASDAMKNIRHRARTLRISGWTSEEETTVSFRDSGEGVDPERLEQMFAPLYTTKGEGLGLGLSICKRIVGAHRGRIWAERNNEDGLTVNFSIPRNLVVDRATHLKVTGR